MIYVFKKFIGFISYTDVIFSLLLVLNNVFATSYFSIVCE